MSEEFAIVNERPKNAQGTWQRKLSPLSQAIKTTVGTDTSVCVTKSGRPLRAVVMSLNQSFKRWGLKLHSRKVGDKLYLWAEERTPKRTEPVEP